MLIVMQFDAIRDDEVDEAAEERKGCLRGGLQLILFLLVPLVVLVALIPTLLSMDGGRRWVLASINKAAEPARVSFERWSLGWFRAPVLEAFSFSDPQHGIAMSAKRVAFDRGLLRLLPIGVLDLGEVTLSAPELDLDLAPPPPPAEPKARKEKEKKGTFFLPIVDIAATLNVTGGRVAIHGGSAGRCVAEQVEGRVALTSYRKPIEVKTRAQIGGGLVALEGRIQSIRDLSKGTETEQPERITLKAVDVDITAFAPLIQHMTGDAWIRSGKLEGALTAAIRSSKLGMIEGGLAVSQLSVRRRARSRRRPAMWR